MDIQSAIENLKRARELYLKDFGERADVIDLYDTVISAMQELQQYRQLGASPQRCAELISERSAAKRILAHYETIGTLEECREAVKRQQAKEPYYEGDGYADGQPVYDTWICPCCGKAYEVDYDDYGYCPNCGQKLDWSEEE